MQKHLTESWWRAETTEPVLELTIGGVLERAAAERPDHVAYVDGSAGLSIRPRRTFSEFLQDALAAARFLSERFAPGERVAIMAPTMQEWMTLMFGSALAGTVMVCVNPAYKASELRYVLSQSQASGLAMVTSFYDVDLAATVADLRVELPALREVFAIGDVPALIEPYRTSSRALPEVSPEAPAIIQYTSGTTGFPKAAVLPHRGVVNSANFVAQRLGTDGESIWLNTVPMFHIGGCGTATLAPICKRATQVITQYKPGHALNLLESERITVYIAVPTMILGILNAPGFGDHDVSSLRVVMSGGAAVPPAMVHHIEDALGARFVAMYGQSECCAVASMSHPTDTVEEKAETAGRALPHTEIKICDIAGNPVPCGIVGEIALRGFGTMLGYHQMPELTAEAIDAEGWLHTGDLGTLDERGFVRVTGRMREMIIRGGVNIYPREIEDVLYEHPAIASVAVVGVPDEYYGEEIAACVVLKPGTGPQAEELTVHVRQRLTHYKVPNHWVFTNALPTTATGKIQKFVLRQRLAAAAADPAEEPASAQLSKANEGTER